LFLFSAVAIASSQSNPSDYPYLLRLEHATFQAHSCALLQNNGNFHVESDRGDHTKVFEGTIGRSDLLAIQSNLNSNALTNLSQTQIEEPLVPSHHDTLQVHVYRTDHWQDLLFESSDSQEPLRQWLQPLVRLIDGLKKSSRRELSEDEGKNNCLPAKVIALSKRQDVKSDAPARRKADPAPLISHSAKQTAVTQPPSTALLYLRSFAMKAVGASQSCVLITEDGTYRFEERTQESSAKRVATEVIAGQIAPGELTQLQQLLSDPGLTKIGHREPPGTKPLPVMGDVTEIAITRPAGVQNIVLSSGFGRRQMGFFYGGDADPSTARPLLRFLTEHVRSRKSERLPPTFRNDCQSP
jgi:hypothetical protein